MSDINNFIKKSGLPKILKDYLHKSKKIKDLLNEEMVNDIEELFHHFNSLFIFNEADFSNHTIQAIMRCKDTQTFYFYLKKVIESSVDYELKDNVNYVGEYRINADIFNQVIEESTIHFIKEIDKIYKSGKHSNPVQTFKLFGKLELINELVDDPYLKDLLASANNVLQNS